MPPYWPESKKEPITKSDKLVTLQALLQMDALRTGADVAEIAWTAAARSPVIRACWPTPSPW